MIKTLKLSDLPPITLPALLLIFALGAFPHSYNKFESSNELSRLYLAHALVYGGSTSINGVISKWGTIIDKSEKGGLYYSDKAPGSSWLAALPVFIARGVSALMGRSLDRNEVLAFARIVAVVFPCLIFFLYLLEKLGSFGLSRNAAFAAVVAYASGSQAWVYSTLLYGHQLSAAALFTSYLLLRPTPSESARPRLFWAGLLLGLSVALDYVALWGALCLLTYALVQRRASNPWFWPGLLIPIAGLALYNWASFGGPLTTGYSFKSYAHDAAIHARGVLGVSFPEWDVLKGILFSRKRGLFYWSPWLLFSLPGFMRMARVKNLRADLALSSAIILGTAALVSGFSDWTAGWSFGPRHLTVILPFFLAPLALEIEAMGRIGRTVFVILAALSITAVAMVVITFPHLPAQLDNPFTDLVWPLFAAGDAVPLFGFAGSRASIIFAAIIVGSAVAFLAALMAEGDGIKPLKTRILSYRVFFLFAVAMGAAALCVGFQAYLPGQDDAQSHFSMSQVYAAVGDNEAAYSSLEKLAAPENSVDLRLYAAYRLWKMAPEMGKSQEALRWREEFIALKARRGKAR